MMNVLSCPKAELHVHLEGTVRPALLRRIAARHGVVPPGHALKNGSRPLISEFSQFARAWIETSSILRDERDFHDVALAYAGEAAAQGCVYVEASFSPAEPARRGARWEAVFEGYCSGAQAAREAHGIEMRLVPEITRDFPLESAEAVARWAVRYRDRGIVGLGLGGNEAAYPPELFAWPFALARDGGLHSAPHAGETAGPESVRAAIEVLKADRLRHGVRSAEDDGLLSEMASRSIVCDVAPSSNVFLGVVPALAQHPLPSLLSHGVRCSISTDDPALLGIDLTHECELAVQLSHEPRLMFEHALDGAFCDDALRKRLRDFAERFDWDAVKRVRPATCQPKPDLLG